MENTNVLKDIRRFLKEIRDLLSISYPHPTDIDAFYSDTHTVPAGTTLTLTFQIAGNWRVRLKKLYADAVPNVTYEWSTPQFTVRGNEIEFVRGIDMEQFQTFRLRMTNTGTVDEDVDVLITGFAKRLRYG